MIVNIDDGVCCVEVDCYVMVYEFEEMIEESYLVVVL